MSRLFKTLPLLPIYNPRNPGVPTSGKSIGTNEFCKKKYGETCKDFYASHLTEGFHTCPYGFAVRAMTVGGETAFFTSIAVEGVSDNKKLYQGDRLKGPILTKEFIDGAVDQHRASQEVRTGYNQLKKENQHLTDTMHEVRNYNSQLKANCQSVRIDTDQNVSKPEKVILNNLAVSQMITSRLDYLVYNVNPAQSTKEKISIYKKTDKVIKTIQAEAKSKQVKIEYSGQTSFGEVWAYSFVEQVPAILIQNAVKYALQGTTVTVGIEERFRTLIFTVENTGPYIHEDEREKVFQKGYRGKEVKNKIDGTGTGLWFLKKVVDIHKATVQLKVGTATTYQTDQISSIRFEVKFELASS